LKRSSRLNWAACGSTSWVTNSCKVSANSRCSSVWAKRFISRQPAPATYSGMLATVLRWCRILDWPPRAKRPAIPRPFRNRAFAPLALKIVKGLTYLGRVPHLEVHEHERDSCQLRGGREGRWNDRPGETVSLPPGCPRLLPPHLARKVIHD